MLTSSCCCQRPVQAVPGTKHIMIVAGMCFLHPTSEILLIYGLTNSQCCHQSEHWVSRSFEAPVFWCQNTVAMISLTKRLHGRPIT